MFHKAGEETFENSMDIICQVLRFVGDFELFVYFEEPFCERGHRE